MLPLLLALMVPSLERVVVDGKGFVLADSRQPFIPWGFNYDRDAKSRLLEAYWETEWETVASDFREMKALGANMVRIHLQAGKFLRSRTEADPKSIERLTKLIRLAESVGLYLDLTGLGCYHKAEVPAWYDDLSEADRWQAQVVFWKAVAGVGKTSPAVFCYDLMNEPVVPGGKRAARDWLGPAFAGKCYVQFITLDQAGRPRAEIARAWIDTLAKGVREVDPDHLITVGMVDWSLPIPKKLYSGFDPNVTSKSLDFLAVHVYPEAGKVSGALDVLKAFAEVGKPVVVEETFPLKAGKADFQKFLHESKPLAAGWIGFYWGQTREEARKSATIGDALFVQWLDLFRDETEYMTKRKK